MILPKKGELIAGIPFDPRRSGNKFEYIVYPESAPADWIEILKNQGYCFCVSPLHNADTTGQGEHKKDHYHLLIVWPNAPTKWQTAATVCDITKGPICIPIVSLRLKYDYLTHKNDPNKAQYDPKDIQCINGFAISNFESLTNDETQKIMNDLSKMCYEQHITEYSDLIFYLLENEMTDSLKVAQSHTIYFSAICKGIWRKCGHYEIDTDTGEVISKD